MNKLGILHLVDSLDSGGAEHVAVSLANNLPQERYRSYLCASRKGGPLQSRIRPHVSFCDLHRRGRFDFSAVIRLAMFTHQEHIRIIHAHTSSLFLAIVVALLNRNVKVIWHDHNGLYGIRDRFVPIYRVFALRADAVIAATEDLAKWSVHQLGVPPDRVLYLPNFVESLECPKQLMDLPGRIDKRIVCVANVRIQKDHLNLVRAMANVVEVEPDVKLILVGADNDVYLAEQVRDEIRRLELEKKITWLGPRQDVASILDNCSIGVLSSMSEAFPVVLLEYGRAGLAVVATQVGQAAEILEDGHAGILVPPANSDVLAAALLQLLSSPHLRVQLGNRLSDRVRKKYTASAIFSQLCQVYEHIL
jgi:glycosyltransferase involved in cell wall biosynthesis